MEDKTGNRLIGSIAEKLLNLLAAGGHGPAEALDGLFLAAAAIAVDSRTELLCVARFTERMLHCSQVGRGPSVAASVPPTKKVGFVS